MLAAAAGFGLLIMAAVASYRHVRHRLRVVEVRQEAPVVVSVICRGQHLDRLAISGGQFFLWHFLTRERWWRGHPYSLSALPRPPYIRVAIKDLGDHSGAAASLRPGTRVAIQGPYGAFTRHALTRGGVALFAAGVGITPIRALLEDLPAGPGNSARRWPKRWLSCTGLTRSSVPGGPTARSAGCAGGSSPPRRPRPRCPRYSSAVRSPATRPRAGSTSGRAGHRADGGRRTGPGAHRRDRGLRSADHQRRQQATDEPVPDRSGRSRAVTGGEVPRGG
jgi:hypothetical protein